MSEGIKDFIKGVLIVIGLPFILILLIEFYDLAFNTRYCDELSSIQRKNYIQVNDPKNNKRPRCHKLTQREIEEMQIEQIEYRLSEIEQENEELKEKLDKINEMATVRPFSYTILLNEIKKESEY